MREQGEGFAWELKSAPAALTGELQRLELTLPQPLPPGYVSEYCPGLKPLVAALGRMLEQGALLFMDYGYPRAAYYHPDRSMGTLMCHYRQRAHEDVFLHPGLQDITAYVDFTAVAEAGEEAGLELAGYTTQAHFLMGLDIAAMAGSDLQLAQQVKLLTLPDEMGERFKAIGLTRRLDQPLSGFALRDLSRML